MFRRVKRQQAVDIWMQFGINRKKTYTKTGELVSAFISYVFLLMISIGSFCIYTDVFSYDGEKGSAFFYLAGAGLLLFVIYVGIPFVQAVRSGRLWHPAWAHILTAVCLIAGYMKNSTEIQMGAKIIWNEWMLKCGAYYGVSMPFVKESLNDGMKNGTAVLFLFLLLLWWFAVGIWCWEKILAATAPVIGLVSMELLVGFAPGLAGMILVSVGLFGIRPFCRIKSERNENQTATGMAVLQAKSGIWIAGILFVCIAAAAGFGTKSAETLIQNQNRIQEYQWAIEDRMLEWKLFDIFQIETGRVSNRRPVYEEKNVMEITISKKPEEPVYLRGYAGDTYQNGIWTNTGGSDFKETVAEWQIDLPEGGNSQNQAGQAVLNLAYQSQMQDQDDDMLIYSIAYLDTENDYGYFPYFTNLDSVTGENETAAEISVHADAFVLREGNETLFIQGAEGNNMLEDPGEFYLQEPFDVVADAYESSWLPRYLEVSNNLKQIESLGKELLLELGNYEEFFYDSELENQNICKEMAAVYLVRKAIFERTVYRLNLANIPAGKDVVENFLFYSGEGFCQHYASAGALLLREMGIPARYVTGYVIHANDFAERNGSYSSFVKDSQAHAWAEVYRPGMGWIPVEMTKGQDSIWNTLDLYLGKDGTFLIASYKKGERSWLTLTRSEGLETDQEDLQWIYEEYGEYLRKSEEEEGASGEKSNGEPGDESQPATEENSRLQPDTAEHSQEKEQNGTPQGRNGEEEQLEETGRGGMLLRWMFTAGLLLAGMISGIFMFYMADKIREGRLLGRIERSTKNYRKAVCGISAATYKILKKKGISMEKHMDDREFWQEVIQKLTMVPEEELKQYYAITERAAFSNEEISREEAVYCYNLYRKIKLLKIK